jgi:hypothetical protein
MKRLVIFAADKKDETDKAGHQVISYKPDIKDLRVVDRWAFEWGYFEVSVNTSTTHDTVKLRGKIRRVLKRQPDGSWRFARVMWNPV